ncbi:unnamed protein product [Owenia fusiformis]|uniref:PKD domain-containing protein n=1 Tax=Owenia fusiformis TaxID=6347 RepID=A0A8S4NVN2_OWEFU|nr:unnamed protein product [Owenia fusiformis]
MKKMSEAKFIFLVVFAWNLAFISAVVTSENDKKINEIIKISKAGDLRKELTRIKRQASTPGGARSNSGELEVHIQTLEDPKHNEAIVHWSGSKSNAIFVLTRENGGDRIRDSTLWRSEDYGNSFEKVTFQHTNVLINFFYACPLNKDKIILTDTKNKVIYRSTNEGKNFTYHPIGFSPDKIIFNPSVENLVLAYTYSNRTLYVSNDLGKSWDLVHNHVNSRFFWAVKGVDKDSATIHMEVQDTRTGEYRYTACVKPYMDGCNSLPELDIGDIDMYSLVVQDEYIFAQKTDFMSGTLYVSYNRKPFRAAMFPQGLHPQDFRILDTDEHQVFLAVDHVENIVNLYLSDVEGWLFTLTLDRVRSVNQANGFSVDFYEVKGSQGTYIANQEGYNGRDMTTRITFDKGGNWSVIPAPAEDSYNQEFNCKLPACSLFIHLGFSSSMYNIPYILSNVDAPGLIFAQGSPNTTMSFRNSRPNSFMSRDGGHTWSEVFKGSYSFNILDQGGAIVAVADNFFNKTNQIRYSCTEGKIWKNYTYHNYSMHVDGVLNEPGITSLVVSIYGHMDKNQGWVIVKVDFSSILSLKCTDNDYTTWTPYDEAGHECILGQKIIYERRKQRSVCYNGRDYVRPTNKSVCECVSEDFECDYGYTRASGGMCKVEKWFNASVPIAECPEGKSYNKSSGYRKVASDKCKGGIERKYQPKVTPCPLLPPSGLHISTVDRLVVATGSDVNFKLTQLGGSKTTTKYSWNFGDSNTTFEYTGFKKGQSMTHKYSQRGMYTVNCTAYNTAGKTETTIELRVEDEIHGVYIEFPNSVQINQLITFTLSVISAAQQSIISDTGTGNVHFLWTFGDEKPGALPVLTWEKSVQHRYSQPQNFSVSVEATNSVGSLYRKFTIFVYAQLKRVRLTFNSVADNVTDTAFGRTTLAVLLKNKLQDVFSIGKSRFQVNLIPGVPTQADVYFLPINQTDTKDLTLNKLANELVSKIADIQIDVANNKKVNVTGAEIIDDDVPKSGPSTYLAWVIAVPTLTAALVVIILVALYYRKRMNSVRRYTQVPQDATTDALLDDDDPPLRPNPDTSDDDMIDVNDTNPFH